MGGHRVAIIIPALNEAATVAVVVANALPHGLPVVVDDGSTDRTGELAIAAGANVVRHERNLGYDQALNSGAARAAELGVEYFVTMDADGQHDPQVLRSFIAALEAGADVVIGVRDRRQRFAETVFAWFANFRWGIRDPLCGMKAYRTMLYRERGIFDSYGSIGTELALFAARRGCRIAQVPVMTRERDGVPRFGRRFTANMKILRAWWLGCIAPRGELAAGRGSAA